MIRKHADSVPSMPSKHHVCCFLLATVKEQGTTNTQMTGAVSGQSDHSARRKKGKKQSSVSGLQTCPLFNRVPKTSRKSSVLTQVQP